MNMQAATGGAFDLAARKDAKALGVTIESQYTVGEYDIVILSATQSDGLETWLRQTGYHIPQGLGAALAPYIRQGMKFFVARVNLKEHQRTGLSYLRPIQFAFESPKFMLPIRLGMINANGPQDLVVYVLSARGPGRNHRLSHGENAERDGRTGVRAEQVRQVLPGGVRPAGQTRRDARGVHRVRVEHGVVRPLRRTAAEHRRTASAGRILAGQWSSRRSAAMGCR